MARYMFQASYSAEGIKGVLKEGGTGRRAAVEAAAKSLGGKLEAFYYAFGDTDVFVGIKTTVLMTPEEIDQATKKAMSYRPPGR